MRQNNVKSESAQTMVEFALVAPIFFVVVWGIMLLGWTYGKQLDLQSATREGARQASISFDHDDPVTETMEAVRNAASLTDDDDIDISVTPTPSPQWEHGDTVTVTASTPWSFDILGVAGWSGTLRSVAEVRVE